MEVAPFIFGRTVEGNDFTDRQNEREHLVNNFLSLTNTTIISPRRWGKSSLVKKVAEDVRRHDKKTKIILIDLFNARSEQQFLEQFASAVTAATSDKLDDCLEFARTFLSHLQPQISFSPDAQTKITFTANWAETGLEPDAILDLPEKLAESKHVRVVICLDEFQNIGSYSEPLAFQKKLRAHWQTHQQVCYCLYGSKRHMLLELFSDPSLPFYRFGDLMLLEKIPNAEWATFIVKQFKNSGKHISFEVAEYLANLVENHSYYVQQLAQQAWLRTANAGQCDQITIDTSFDAIKDQLSLLFASMVDGLTARQLNFLRAVIDGVQSLYSVQTLRSYDLGTSANIGRIKEALLKNEIIDITGRHIEILDPVFKHWLNTDYFI